MAQLNGTGRLGDDLYLLAHHEVTGKPHLQSRAQGLGLAGALLAELALCGTICVQRGTVMIAGPEPRGDDLAGWVLGLLASEAEQLPARDWLLYLAPTAAVNIARRLERAGYLARTSPRRPWGGERWVPVNQDCAFAPLLRVKAALGSSGPVTAYNAALAGLAAACGLGAWMSLYLPAGARGGLEEAPAYLHPSLREVVAQTQAAVDSAVLSHRM